MKNKLRIVAALCAVVMSTSVVMPASAIPSNDVDFVGTRLKIVSDRLGRSTLSTGNENRKNIERLLNATSSLFYKERAVLLSSSNENAYSAFLHLHNKIDKLFNDIDINDLKTRGYDYASARLNENKMKELFYEIKRVPTKYKLVYSKFKQIEERISQLSVRFLYSKANLEKSKACLSHSDVMQLEADFDSNNTEFNEYLGQAKEIIRACKHDDRNDLNDVACQLNSGIDNFHKKINDFNNDIEQKIIKRNPKVSDIESIVKRISDVKSRFGFDESNNKFPDDTFDSQQATKKILEMESYIDRTEEKQKLNLQYIHNSIDYAISFLERNELSTVKHLESTPIDSDLFRDYCNFIYGIYSNYGDGFSGHSSDDFLQVFHRRVDQLKNRIGYLSCLFGNIFNKQDVKGFDKALTDVSSKHSAVNRKETRKYNNISSLTNQLQNVLNFNEIFKNVNISEDQRKNLEEQLKTYKSTLGTLSENIVKNRYTHLDNIANHVKDRKNEMESLSRNARSRFDLVVKDFNSMLSSLKGEYGFSIDGVRECGFRSMDNKINNIHNDINSLEADLYAILNSHDRYILIARLTALANWDDMLKNDPNCPEKCFEKFKEIFNNVKNWVSTNHGNLKNTNKIETKINEIENPQPRNVDNLQLDDED